MSKFLKISIVIAFLISGNLMRGQSTFYSITGGAWSNLTTLWSTTSHNGLPCLCWPTNSLSGKTVNIYNSMTESASLSIGGGNAATVNLLSGAKLTINGNLTLTKGSALNIAAGDTVIVTGTLTMTNGTASTITSNGFLEIQGAVDISGGNSVTGTGNGSYGSISGTITDWFSGRTATNLVTNGGGETTGPTASGGGWTQVSIGAVQGAGSPVTGCYGSGNWRILGNQNGYPTAHGGSYIIMPGCSNDAHDGDGSNYEIYQDIDVSSNATFIDDGLNNFSIDAWVQSYSQSNPDGTEIIVEYRSASNTLLSTPYNSGFLHSQGSWTEYNPSPVMAPSGTRKVRVRLIGQNTDGYSIDAYFDDISLTTNMALSLPIVLLSFTAENTTSNTVLLKWTTVTELNNDYFTIDRTTDEQTYETVAKIKGAGNSNELLNYETVDENPLKGLSYYRLTQTDYNGKSVSYPIIPFNYNQFSSGFIIYPNPSDGKTISISTSSKNIGENMDISVSDLYGRTISQKSFVINQETMSLSEQLGIPQLNPGMYFIKGIINNKNYSLPFMVK